jgi:hypothetical protein
VAQRALPAIKRERRIVTDCIAVPMQQLEFLRRHLAEQEKNSQS